MARKRYRTNLMVILVVFAVLLMPIRCTTIAKAKEAVSDYDFIAHFLDVGQGDATFIELSDGKCVLIDCGNGYGKYIVNYINKLGYKQLDYFIATHADLDHIGSAEYVINNLKPKTIYRPYALSVSNKLTVADELINLNDDKILIETSNEYAQFINSAYTNCDDIKVISSNEAILSNDFGYMLRFYYPIAVGKKFSFAKTSGYKVEINDNNNGSAIMVFSGKTQSMLMLSDTTAEIQNSVEFGDVMCDITIVKAGHHGAKNCTSSSVLNKTSVQHIIASCAKDNSYGHPSEQIINMATNLNANFYTTYKDGSITLNVLNNGTITKSYLDKQQKTKAKIVVIAISSVVVLSIVATSVIYTVYKAKIINKKNIDKIK